MFNKKDKTKKEKTIKRKILKIIFWMVGFLAIAVIVLFMRIRSMFSSVPNRFEKFWGKMTDPCYEVYANSVCTSKDRSRYEIKNDRVCVHVPLSSGGDFAGIKIISVQDADPNTFKELKCYYSKDKDNVYYYNQKVQDADPNTFEVIDCAFGKDKNHKYSFGEMVR